MIGITIRITGGAYQGEQGHVLDYDPSTNEIFVDLLRDGSSIGTTWVGAHNVEAA